MTEHSINRNGATANSTDEHTDEDENADDEEQRSEAEIKRELRKSVVGRAILSYDRRRRR